MRSLERTLGKQNAVVAQDADRNAVDVGEAGHQRRPVKRLELVERGAVDKPRNHFADVVLLFQIGGHDTIELGGIVFRLGGLGDNNIIWLFRIKVGDDAAAQRQRMAVVLGQIVRNAGFFGVHLGAAEFFGADNLAGRGLHQRRTAEKDRALVLYDDGFVRHRRHVGAAGRA